MTINNRIRSFRKDHLCVTQEKLAEQLGVTRSYINGIEGGKMPSLEFVVKMSDVFNLNLNWLLKDEGRMYNENQDDKIDGSLFDSLESMMQETQRVIEMMKKNS